MTKKFRIEFEIYRPGWTANREGDLMGTDASWEPSITSVYARSEKMAIRKFHREYATHNVRNAHLEVK